jgi:hypothetical protein
VRPAIIDGASLACPTISLKYKVVFKYEYYINQFISKSFTHLIIGDAAEYIVFDRIIRMSILTISNKRRI